MALPFRSLAVVSAVIVGAGLFTASNLSMSAGVVGIAAIEAPVAAGPGKPSYVARMPVVDAEALNGAKSGPVTVAKPMIVTASVAVVPPRQPIEAELTVTPSYSHQVAVSGANVRSGPNKNNAQLFTLRQDDWVNVSDNVQGWLKITDETGREGWVYGQLLQEVRTSVATTY